MRYYVLLGILLLGCNPVRQVLKDKEKLDQVAEVVIRSGYCTNDTIIQSKSDTLVSYDTTYLKGLDIIHTKTDSLLITKLVTKKVIIRDTIQKIVTDNSKIKLLENDILDLRKANLTAQEKANEYKDLAKRRWWWLILLITLNFLFIIRKPLIRFLQWHLPMLK